MSARHPVPCRVGERRGFTLVELMVALVLGTMVAGLIHRQLLHGRRLARAQLERTALQDNVRVAALLLAGELAPLGYDEVTPEAAAAMGAAVELRSDLRTLGPGAVTYLALRGAGHVCGAAPAPTAEIVIASHLWRAHRAPRSTDSLLVLVENDPATNADDAWIHLGVLSSVASSCPSGEAGVVIRVGVPASLAPEVLERITAGSPARLAEVMQIRHYASGGKSWLGMRSVSTGEAITPVAGPLADSTATVRGLTLRYLDARGAPTSEPSAVRAVEAELIGVTDQPIQGRDMRRALIDSFALTTRVTLRNAPRP